MAAWYHGRRGLGAGHTFPIGEPWLPGLTCELFLVSLPYPFGPELEVCNLSDGHLHVLWLLPITVAEREFNVREGSRRWSLDSMRVPWSTGFRTGPRRYSIRRRTRCLAKLPQRAD